MSQVITVAQSGAMEMRPRKRTAKIEPARPGKLTLNFLLVVLICAAGVFYIFEVNNIATQGYHIERLEKEAQELRENNVRLKIREAELRSMYNIEQETKNLDMVAPDGVSYLSLPGNMAMK